MNEPLQAIVAVAAIVSPIVVMMGGLVVRSIELRLGRIEHWTEDHNNHTVVAYERLARIEEAHKAMADTMTQRFDRQDGRFDRIEGKIDRNGRH